MPENDRRRIMMRKIRFCACLAAVLLSLSCSCVRADASFAAPGDATDAAMEMLHLAANMGFVRNLGKQETTYREKYKDGVMRMERAFGLADDGIVTEDEMAQLRLVLYPGSKTPDASAVLERICDLGFYAKKLPDDHSEYKASYETYIRSAERALNLTVDGKLTASEQAVILSQPVEKPDPVNKVSLKGYKDYVKLSWNKVQGALWYDVFRDDELIASVTSINYQDYGVRMDQSYNYSVRSCRYGAVSDIDYRFSVHVDITYTGTNLKALNENQESKIGKFVRLTGLRKEDEAFFDGKNLYQLVSNSGKYGWLLIRNYSMQVWPGDGIGLYEHEKVTSITVAGEMVGTRESEKHGVIPVIRSVETRFSTAK